MTTNMPVVVSASVLRTLDKVAAKTLDKLHRRGIALYAKALCEVSGQGHGQGHGRRGLDRRISAVRETLALAKLPAAQGIRPVHGRSGRTPACVLGPCRGRGKRSGLVRAGD